MIYNQSDQFDFFITLRGNQRFFAPEVTFVDIDRKIEINFPRRDVFIYVVGIEQQRCFDADFIQAFERTGDHVSVFSRFKNFIPDFADVAAVRIDFITALTRITSARDNNIDAKQRGFHLVEVFQLSQIDRRVWVEHFQ